MKKTIGWVCLLVLLFVGQAWGANLALFTVQNPGFSENYKFYIDIYGVSTGDNFELGTSSLKIGFNDAVLSNPVLSEQNTDFNDNTLYDAMSVSAAGAVATFAITPKGAAGTILPSTETRLARITFDINISTYTTETSGIAPSPGTSSVHTAAGGLVLINFTGDQNVSLVCLPSISGTPATSVTAGDAYSFTPTASGDCSPVTFEIQNQPSWAAFSTSTGALTGTPAAGEVGTYSNIIITVRDPDDDTDSLAAFNIQVTPNCTAPTISGAPTSSYAKVGATYSFTPTVSGGCTPLSFSGTNTPAWATVDTSTGVFSGTPLSAHVGTYTGIVITVTDNNSDSDDLTAFDVEVCNVTAISGTPATSVTAGDAYSFTPTYTGCGNPTFEITHQPSWAAFSTATGALTGTPAVGDVGTYSDIIIKVTDEASDEATLATFSIQVNPSCTAPTISGTPGSFAKVGSTYTFTPTVSGGCTPLSFSGTNTPTWATVDTGTGVLSGTPQSTDVGTDTGIVITVTDSTPNSDDLSAFDIEICNAVAISGTPATSVTAGTAYSFTPTYTAGCGTTTFEIANRPSWATFDTATGALTGTPGASDVATYSNIIIGVKDDANDAAALTAFSIDVTSSGSSGGGGGGGGCFISALAP